MYNLSAFFFTSNFIIEQSVGNSFNNYGITVYSVTVKGAEHHQVASVFMPGINNGFGVQTRSVDFAAPV